MIRRPPRSTLFPTRRSSDLEDVGRRRQRRHSRADAVLERRTGPRDVAADQLGERDVPGEIDRKSTRLNSSHGYISYAVFCLKKKKNNTTQGGRPDHESALAA